MRLTDLHEYSITGRGSDLLAKQYAPQVGGKRNQMLHSANEKSMDFTARIVKDFKEWSGGFTPAECGVEEIRAYVDSASPSDLDPAQVYEFLMHWAETATDDNEMGAFGDDL